MIANGPTTLWESWEGTPYAIEGGGTSRNHIMFGGGVNRFIAAAIGGLTIDTSLSSSSSRNGWRELLVHPSPAAMRTLGKASVSRRTPQGVATVSWRAGVGSGGVGGGGGGSSVLELNLTVPVGSRADVRLPLLLGPPPSTEGEELRSRAVSVSGGGGGGGSSCAIRCTAALDAEVAGGDDGGCLEAQGIDGGAVRCERRLDGEMVVAMVAVSGSLRFSVEVS
jgi:hypothetical protein